MKQRLNMFLFFFNIQVAHAFLNMYELYCSAITSFSTKDLQRLTVLHTKYDQTIISEHDIATNKEEFRFSLKWNVL